MTSAPRDGRQARWDQHKEERRQQIIDAAIAVIESHEPGAEIHVQEIAARAGLSRTVIYRHFADRADLDLAVQARIIDDLWQELLPGISLSGTVPEIIERVIGTYVRWAVAHPALHRRADHDIGGPAGQAGPLERGLERIAAQVAQVVGVGLVALGGTVTEEDVEALDPLVYGLVGAVFSSVRRWISRPDRTLSPEMLITLTSQSIWFVIDGHARRFGVAIDPTRPVEEMTGEVFTGSKGGR